MFEQLPHGSALMMQAEGEQRSLEIPLPRALRLHTLELRSRNTRLLTPEITADQWGCLLRAPALLTGLRRRFPKVSSSYKPGQLMVGELLLDGQSLSTTQETFSFQVFSEQGSELYGDERSFTDSEQVNCAWLVSALADGVHIKRAGKAPASAANKKQSAEWKKLAPGKWQLSLTAEYRYLDAQILEVQSYTVDIDNKSLEWTHYCSPTELDSRT